MTESEFNPIAIYNHLVNLRIKPQSGGKNANGEAQLISNLRIDMASVLKEVNRHRACDAGTCFYCREWALLIHKKTYNARNHGQNANGNDVNSTVEAENKKPKEAATEICQQYYDFINQYGEKIKLGSTNEIETNLVDSIVQKTFTWIKSPNSLYAPPKLFTPVEFDTPQQAVVYSKQENDILNAIEIEKSHLVIQKDSFPFLKNINKIQKCGHTRPDWKNPSDLDLDRRVFNDKLLKEEHKNEEILAESLSQVWLYVNNFLTSMLQLEEKRDLIFGKGCATKLSSFMKEYQDECLSFNDFWAPIAEANKKSGKSKKGNANLANVVDDIDTAFCTYINNARTVISLWEEGFVEKVFNDAIQFGEETQRTLTSLIVESKERIVNGRVQKFHSNIITKCSDASRTAKDIKLLISKRMSILRTEITTKNKEFVQELEVLEDSYKNESQKTLQGRLEKANNKEFRKRIKKFENAVQGFRQHAINSIGNFFSVTEFTDICTRCLEILMMEGEMWEAIQLGRNYKNYEAMSQKLESQRQQILKYYNEGVETGRFVLSGIIGRLFLKEAQRQQDETLALEKQESFLQSMKQESGKKKKDQGQSTTELVEPESPKKKKNKKRKNTVDKEMNSESNNDTKKQEQFIRDMIEKDDPFDIFKFANSETVSTSSPQSYSTSNSKPKETTESYSTSNSKTKQTTESYSTSNSKPKETTESYSISNSKPKQTTESYSTSNSKPKETTESYSTSNSKPKQTTESYSTSNSKPKQTTESYSTSNSKPKQTTESYSTSNSKPKQTTESYSTSNSKPKQTTESYSTSNSKPKETTESYSTSNSKPKETTERQLSIPPGLNPPGDTYSQPSPNDDSSLPNGNHDDASKLNLDVLSRPDLIMLIQNLSTEKTQLVNTMILMQQEVKAMTVRYANLMEMARDRELQIETRKQQELEEAKKYIQALELKISHLEKQNIASNGNSGSTSPKSGSSPESPIGTSSTSQISQPSGFNLFPTNRTGPGPLIGSKKYLNPWRSSASGSGHMRCGNCGDQGHVSQECTVGCRYCGNSGHLSENCDFSNYGSGSKENGIKC